MARTPRLLLTTAFVASTLAAQGAPAPAPVSGTSPAPAEAGGAAASPAGPVDVSVKQKPMLAPEEMVNQSKEYFKSMNDVLKRIQALQEQAKRQKDIIRLNCVTDKLVQGKVNLNIAEQSMSSLQENISRGDEGGRTHEFTRLTIVNQKVSVLGADAENCSGDALSIIGATRVDVDVDPNIPQTDPTQPPAPGIDIERPGEASTMG